MISRALRSVRNAGNVAVLGAAGGIGQPLSLLLKANPNINNLRLFDIAATPGVALIYLTAIPQPTVPDTKVTIKLLNA